MSGLPAKRMGNYSAMKKGTLSFCLICIFIIYMHFEGFIKLYFDYHYLAHGFKYIFSFAFFSIWMFKIGFPKNKGTWPVLAVFSLVTLQFLNPLMWEGQGHILSVIGALYYVAYLPLFFICYKTFDLKRTKIILYLILALVTFSAIVAHYQHHVGWRVYVHQLPWKLAISSGWNDPEWISLRNFVFHGPLAFDVKPPRYWYVAGFVILLMFLFSFSLKKTIYPFYVLLALNSAMALWLSGYRFAILGTLIGVIIILAANISVVVKRVKVYQIIIGLFVIVISTISIISYVGTGGEGGTYNIGRYQRMINPVAEYINQRGYTWNCLVKNAINFPLGIGLRAGAHITDQSYRVSSLPVAVGDNWLLTVSAEVGILAFFSVIWIYVVAARQFITNLFALDGLKRSISIGCFAMLIIFVFEVGFLPGEGPSYWMFWLFLGILFKLNKMQE